MRIDRITMIIIGILEMVISLMRMLRKDKNLKKLIHNRKTKKNKKKKEELSKK